MAPGITLASSQAAAAGASKKRKASLPQSLSADEPAVVKEVAHAAAPKVKKAKKEKTEASPSSPPTTAAAAPTVAGPTSPEAFRKAHDITVKAFGAGVPPLYQTFEDAAEFPECLQKALTAAGFTAPSPIQAQAWPLAMTGRDVLATAKTGSGKTCGYLLPAIAAHLKSKAGPAGAAATTPSSFGGRGGAKGKPTIVVMAPTRELAVQINQEAARFARAAGLKSVAVYGGAPKGPQIRDLQSGAQIVIATPGRLNDLLAFTCHDGSAVLTLEHTRTLVLDEADRMCDMGFEEDIKKIVAQMPATRQTLFFTATWPKAVARVANTILRNPIQVSIGSSDELRANKDIKQVVKVTDQGSKRDLLMQLVKDEVTEGSRTIIFCNKKYICDELENSLWEAGYNVSAIHGDRSQQDREWAISEIRAGKMPLLVATDVAARGIDIKNLDRVVNFDFPNNTEDYIHRIGRTGRAGASGVAHTFFTAADGKYAHELVKILREAKQDVPKELEQLASSGGGGYGGRNGSRGGNNRWRGGGGGGGGRGRGGFGGQRRW